MIYLDGVHSIHIQKLQFMAFYSVDNCFLWRLKRFQIESLAIKRRKSKEWTLWILFVITRQKGKFIGWIQLYGIELNWIVWINQCAATAVACKCFCQIGISRIVIIDLFSSNVSLFDEYVYKKNTKKKKKQKYI